MQNPLSLPKNIAIVGSGPAGLMAADVLASHGHRVTVYEKRKGIAWKLYVAGSSGLNITNNFPLDLFAQHYTGPADFWQKCLSQFSPQDWLQFIEKTLGLGTFLGTSGRYFVETMHAAQLIRGWRKRLENLGVQFKLGAELLDFTCSDRGGWMLQFSQQQSAEFDCLGFCLGGGSYEPTYKSLDWPIIFQNKGLSFREFSPSNTGYELDWPEAFLSEAEGKPLKNILLRSSKGERKGDLVITSYGLEGTPIYFLGHVGAVTIDLKPDLSEQAIIEKMQQSRENLSALRRAQKYLKLSSASQALLYHMLPHSKTVSIPELAKLIKNFPLQLLRPRALSESISSQGGLMWENLDEKLMLKACPGIYCAGEMLDWDAPTGGFLIQACVAQGYYMAQAILST